MVLQDADRKPVESDSKSWIWWFNAITTPLGVMAGSVTLAHMAAGIIEWRGPIEYIVHLWHSQIAVPFQDLLESFSTWAHLPPPPHWVIDYIVLGVLLASSIERAEIVIKRVVPADPMPPYSSVSRELERGDDPAQQFKLLHRALASGVFWPVATLNIVYSFGLNVWLVTTGAQCPSCARQVAERQLLALAPFLIFLALCWLNHSVLAR